MWIFGHSARAVGDPGRGSTLNRFLSAVRDGAAVQVVPLDDQMPPQHITRRRARRRPPFSGRNTSD